MSLIESQYKPPGHFGNPMENGGRHRVSYVCEYYEVLHVWHYTHPGAQHRQGAVKFVRLHQARLRERFPRNGLHPEVCYSALLSVTVIRLARSWVMGNAS